MQQKNIVNNVVVVVNHCKQYCLQYCWHGKQYCLQYCLQCCSHHYNCLQNIVDNNKIFSTISKMLNIVAMFNYNIVDNVVQ